MASDPTPPKRHRTATVASADAAPPPSDPPAEPRVVRVSAHAADTGAELAAVSGPAAAFAAPGTWRVDGQHLPHPDPARTFRVSGPDGVLWESTAARRDGAVLVLDCKRAAGPGGDS